jgi:hypothetical protein
MKIVFPGRVVVGKVLGYLAKIKGAVFKKKNL